MSKFSFRNLPAILLSLVLVLSYQNCSQGLLSTDSNSDIHSRNTGDGISNDGNGTPYDGKLTINAPTVMSPGQSVEVQVRGGTPPYELSTTSLTGAFTDLGNGIYTFTLGSNEPAASFEIQAQDSGGAMESASIQVWGVNNWFFHFPRGMTLAQDGSLLIVEGERPSLTQMTLEGEIVNRWSSDNVSGLSLTNPEKVAMLPSGAVFVTDSFSKLFSIDIAQGRLLREISPDASSLWNACGGIEDIKVSPEGRLALLCHSTVFFLDQSGDVLSTLDISRGQDALAGALAFDPQGNLAVAKMGGLVEVFNLNGEFLRSFNIKNHYQSNVLNTMPRDLAFKNQNEVLYTTEESYGDIVIYSISNDRSRLPEIDPDDQVKWSDMYGIAMLPNGGYVLNEHKGFNIIFHGPGDELGNVYGSKGRGEHFYRNVQDVEIKNSMTTVLDMGNSRLVQYNSKGQFLREIEDERFFGANDIAVDDAGLIYLVDEDDAEVAVFNQNGLLKTLGAGEGSGPGQLSGPTSVTVHGDFLYITDANNGRVVVWTKNGDFVNSFRTGSFPQSLVVLDDRIYVLKRYGAVDVSSYTLEGRHLEDEKFQNPSGLGLGTMHEPREIVYSPKLQKFFVVSKERHNITVFNRQGQFVKQIGVKGWELGEFYRPHGLAVDENGNLFVADSKNARVQILPAYLFQ